MKPLNRVLNNLYRDRNKFASNKKIKDEQPQDWKQGCLDIEEEIKAVKGAIETIDNLKSFKKALFIITK